MPIRKESVLHHKGADLRTELDIPGRGAGRKRVSIVEMVWVEAPGVHFGEISSWVIGLRGGVRLGDFVEHLACRCVGGGGVGIG